MSAARRRHTLGDVLGPLEAEIMEVVWRTGEVTVRDVHRALNRQRKIAYTTVMTTLGRLADKGLLRRIESTPAHHYSALVSRDEYARSTVESVVDWLVSHFPEPAVSYFIDRVEREDEDVIDRLRDAIEQRKTQEQ
ncbi:MAG TPA: BlaI/MecI/CopY family transcriptional regulator [Actinomycetota bacterium]|nr:BlaI/MecI/CopY family transcriptional regulator [Actinomycetota bacterium]